MSDEGTKLAPPIGSAAPLTCQSGDMREEMKCPNMKSIGETWDSESFECRVCGKHYKLYDDEMR